MGICTCVCPEDVPDCPDTGSDACAIAASFRKLPQTMDPPVCGDMDETGNVVVGPDCKALCVVHEPLDPCVYQSSIGVRLQKTIDQARRIPHVLGLRPYRVSLIWQRRNSRQEYLEFRRLEIFPVTISRLTHVDLELEAIGLDRVGAIKLSRISPSQVNEFDLRGFIGGQEVADNEQFFYEVVRQARYPGEQPDRARFTVASVPYFNAKLYQWEVDIVSQHAPRTPAGDDQTLDVSNRERAALRLLKR